VAGSRDHAIEYRFGKLSRFVAAHGNQKQIEEAEGVVFQGLNPLREKTCFRSPRKRKENCSCRAVDGPFANSTKSSESPQTTGVTISNTGTTELTITSVAITGTDMGDFGEDNACAGIAPGRSCVVKVTFTPTTTGARSADLTVMDNTQAGTKNIPLMGTGD
jgi:hypothetical protein